MSKHIVAFLFILISLCAEAEAITGFEYHEAIEIISSVKNDSVPGGTCAVRGYVRDYFQSAPLAQVLITNATENPFAYTDSSGYFEMLFAISDTALYVYKEGYNEVIFTGSAFHTAFKNKHVLTVNFYIANPSHIQVVAKPVIYLYNSPSEVVLKLKSHSEITFVHPKKENLIWHVKSNKDGTIQNLDDQKNYPYIFWEGECDQLKLVSENGSLVGYLINTDSCVTFLENVLTAYGLDDRERTDFITFWGPKMVERQFAFIQFLTNDLYQTNIAELSIDPAPETLIRLFMYWIPLDGPLSDGKIVTPVIEENTRKGFTVVEWGGSQMSIQTLIY